MNIHRNLVLSVDVDQLVEHRTGTPTKVRFLGATRDFSPRVNFQSRLFYGVRTPPCAIACIYICGHVKDPVVHVRVRWIMETLKHPACTLGWVARLCRSWLSPGKATLISHGSNPIGKITVVKQCKREACKWKAICTFSKCSGRLTSLLGVGSDA